MEGWTENGAPVNGTNTGYTLTVTGDATVKVKFKKITTISAGPGAWKLLKRAVEIADNNAVITINGEIKATNAGGNSGQIVIEKNITIKGTNSSNDILNANSGGADAPSTKHRIFMVKSGKKLTLKNLTLKGGKALDYPNTPADGGAIYTLGTLNMTDCTVSENYAEKNGGGIYVINGKVDLTRTTVGGQQYYTDSDPNKTKGNEAKEAGGGIYIKGNKNVDMNDCTVSYNKVAGSIFVYGGGICIESASGTVTMKGGTIQKNEATGSTSFGNARGGGVCIKSNSSSATFIMEGTNPTISQNKASGESNKTYGGGVALMTVGEFKMKSGIIKQNDAENGSGVYLDFKKGPYSVGMYMSGSAQVDYTDDVFLSNGIVNTTKHAFITVTDWLTKPHAARLTMEPPSGSSMEPGGSYTEGRVVVTGSGYSLRTSDIGRFPITQQTVPITQNWTTQLDSTNNNLKLKKQ